MGTAAAAYAGGSELVARAYEAAQQYLLSGGVHTEDSAQRVFQGNRTHFTPPPGTPTGVGRARLHRKSRPSPLRVLGTGTGDGIMVEVPLGSPHRQAISANMPTGRLRLQKSCCVAESLHRVPPVRGGWVTVVGRGRALAMTLGPARVVTVILCVGWSGGKTKIKGCLVD